MLNKRSHNESEVVAIFLVANESISRAVILDEVGDLNNRCNIFFVI
jgi:hypothetical protein